MSDAPYRLCLADAGRFVSVSDIGRTPQLRLLRAVGRRAV
jgi:hypothetical protein